MVNCPTPSEVRYVMNRDEFMRKIALKNISPDLIHGKIIDIESAWIGWCMARGIKIKKTNTKMTLE